MFCFHLFILWDFNVIKTFYELIDNPSNMYIDYLERYTLCLIMNSCLKESIFFNTFHYVINIQTCLYLFTEKDYRISRNFSERKI